jgi:catechol 2,3-dioxygenase-like lactoylglutathione lyase family enzyme
LWPCGFSAGPLSFFDFKPADCLSTPVDDPFMQQQSFCCMLDSGRRSPGTGMALQEAKIVAFVGVSDAARARHFYKDILGLSLLREELPFALVFEVNGVMLRAQLVNEVQPPSYTTLGWDVEDIEATVRELRLGGVAFEKFVGLSDGNELNIWTAPGGARMAWLRDPDGNLLSISQLDPRPAQTKQP